MKRFSLFVLPIFVLILPLAVRQWQINQPYDNGIGGGWKTDLGGERACVANLSQILHRHTLSNIIRNGIFTAEADGKYRQAVDKGTRPYKEWIYELEYNRQDKTLTKRRFAAVAPKRQLLKLWIWHNVSEDAIHQVAAPVLKLKTTFQIEAYKGGNLNELKKYGAWLEEPKMSNTL